MIELRPIAFLACSMIVLAGSAQDQAEGSLTKEFPRMSAKERSRIATEEERSAQSDSLYQQVMKRAEEAFQEGRFEASLRLYQEARGMRPYNVYPKVKIQDLQALLKRHAEEEEEVATARPVAPDSASPASERTKPVAEKPVVVAKPRVSETMRQRDPAQSERQPEVVAPAVGYSERQFREGQAVVLERIMAVDGRAVAFRKASHPSGQVFYFEDGRAVDHRVWNARFGD